MSQQGVQQGDPLGPLLFSLPLHIVVSEIAESCELLLNVWYLDDGTLIGSPPEVAKALDIIQKHASLLGLSLNLNKCELFWPKAEALSSPLLPCSIPRKCALHTELLGSPILAPVIGHDSMLQTEIETFLNGKVDQIQKIHQSLPLLV
jgi:hypothetical protein